MAQIPHGPETLFCPLWQKKMSTVCHKCPLWTQIRGINPNTGAEVDSWNCALGHLPMLLIETAQQSRQTGAAVESFRNQMVAQNQVLSVVYSEPEKLEQRHERGDEWQ